MVESPGRLILGLLTGIVFGFLLQKGQAAKYPVILGQLLLRDWRVSKIMGTAVAVGSAGVYALVAMGATHTAVKPMELGGILAGAFCFGVGMAVLGYCPGTTVAAAGEGNRDALAGLAGMLVGAGAFVLVYAPLERFQRTIADWGKVTLPSVSNTSPWPWVLGLALMAAVAYALDRRRRARIEGGVAG
jgi:uncharacterized membrane protein YedE/YeeE